MIIKTDQQVCSFYTRDYKSCNLDTVICNERNDNALMKGNIIAHKLFMHCYHYIEHAYITIHSVFLSSITPQVFLFCWLVLCFLP